MAKPERPRGLAALISDTAGQVEKDGARMAQAMADLERARHITVRLDAILDRRTNTREIDAAHVEALKTSIQAVGLIQSIVIDRDRRLIVGAHRLAALRALWAENDALSQIDAKQVAFSADEEPARAFDIEMAENEKRRDYTRAEVFAAIDRLKAAGYRTAAGTKPGVPQLGPALKTIIGKSERTARRYLRAHQATQEPTPSSQPHADLMVALSAALGDFVGGRNVVVKIRPHARAVRITIDPETASRLVSAILIARRDEPS